MALLSRSVVVALASPVTPGEVTGCASLAVRAPTVLDESQRNIGASRPRPGPVEVPEEERARHQFGRDRVASRHASGSSLDPIAFRGR